MKNSHLILLAKTDKLKATASKFVCKDTKKTLFTNVANEALSPFSGTSFLRETSKTRDLTAQEVSNFKTVAACPTCNTNWTANDAFIKAHATFHCVVCNEELKTEPLEDEAEDYDIIIINDDTENQPKDKVEDDSIDLVIEINNPESVVVAPEEISEEALPEELSEDAPKEIIEEVEGIETPEEVFEANLTYNLAHLLTKEDYADKVELIASSINKESPSLYLVVNSIPVAVAEFAKASDAVKAMFSDNEMVLKSLQMTLSNSSKEEGNLALKDFGIRPIVAPVISSKAAVASNVAKIARELTAAFKKKEAEMFNVWREAFTTATLMYCKGLQKKNAAGKQKSLITKASIIDTLKSVGINNADLIVEEAFKRGIQRDYGVIVEEALSLYAKTPEARQEVRDFVRDADYSPSTSLASDQATVSEIHVVSANVNHQPTPSVEDIGSIMATLKESIFSRAI